MVRTQVLFRKAKEVGFSKELEKFISAQDYETVLKWLEDVKDILRQRKGTSEERKSVRTLGDYLVMDTNRKLIKSYGQKLKKGA